MHSKFKINDRALLVFSDAWSKFAAPHLADARANLIQQRLESLGLPRDVIGNGCSKSDPDHAEDKIRQSILWRHHPLALPSFNDCLQRLFDHRHAI